jgi:hypothetical protein
MKTGMYISIIVTLFLLLLSGSVYSKEGYAFEFELEKPTHHCAAGHLQIRGVIKNKSNLTFKKVKVEGRAYDENGNLISSTSSWVDSDTIGPGKTALFDLVFLDITGSNTARVKSYDVKAIEAEKASP